MRYLFYSILAVVLVGGGLAAKQVPEPPSQETKDKETHEQKTPEEYKEEMEDFVPSEKVPADSAVSFPVDI